MSFDNTFMPHIRYIIGNKTKNSRLRYYLGGEPPENDCRLTVGKEYTVSFLWYSPDAKTDREYVWACKSDEVNELGNNTYANVDPKNFGTKADLRELRINEIID